MLNGSIRNKLPLFALPVAATAVLEQLFNAAAWPWWAYVYLVSPCSRTFQAIMLVYPISLLFTVLLILIALVWYRPTRRFA